MEVNGLIQGLINLLLVRGPAVLIEQRLGGPQSQARCFGEDRNIIFLYFQEW
jgi:hypothetical protein